MRRMFDRMFGPGMMQVGEDDESMEASLGMDVSETKDKLLVKAAVPGVKPEDIDISVDQGMLTIRGEFREEKKSDEEKPLRQELRYGSFYRALRLPTSVDPEHCEAKMEHGMLELSFPKRPESQPKKIQISAEQKSLPDSERFPNA